MIEEIHQFIKTALNGYQKYKQDCSQIVRQYHDYLYDGKKTGTVIKSSLKLIVDDLNHIIEGKSLENIEKDIFDFCKTNALVATLLFEIMMFPLLDSDVVANADDEDEMDHQIDILTGYASIIELDLAILCKVLIYYSFQKRKDFRQRFVELSVNITLISQLDAM